MSNNGSFDAPWTTLEAVITAHLIEHYQNSPLPYNVTNNQLVIKNQGAPVQAGDTLILRDGKHGSIYLRNFNNQAYITVLAQAGHKPIISDLSLIASTKWRFQGIDISGEPFGKYSSGRLVLLESHDWHGPSKLLEIQDCHIYSTATPWTSADEWVAKASTGIYVRNADSCELLNNSLENIHFGFILTAKFINCVGNSIKNFSGDGIRMTGSNLLVENNIIKNCYKVDENHDDGIQSFTTTGLVVDDNIIRGNTIINYEDPNQPLLGDMQGIGCFDGPYRNWIVENNLIVVNHWHGISFYEAVDCKFVNNTVLDPTPDVAPGPSWIKITDGKTGTPSTGCIIKNNVANTYDLTGDASHNVSLSTYSDYQLNFVDYASYDYQLLSTSILVDAADDVSASQIDKNGISRPQGAHADIGCYEYVSPDLILDVLEVPFSVYPNPASDVVSIRTNIQNYSAVLLDFKGQALASDIDGCIEVSHLVSAIYFIKVIDNATHKTWFVKWVKN